MPDKGALLRSTCLSAFPRILSWKLGNGGHKKSKITYFPLGLVTASFLCFAFLLVPFVELGLLVGDDDVGAPDTLVPDPG